MFWTALSLVVALVVLCGAYLVLTLQTARLLFFVGTGVEGLLTIIALLGTAMIYRHRPGWGARLTGGALLATLVLMTLLFAGMGPLILVVTLLTIPALAAQILPARQADQISRGSAVTGVIVGLLTLFSPLEGLVLPGLQAALNPLLALAFVPSAALMVREFRTYNLRGKLILVFVLAALIPIAVLAYLTDRATRRALVTSADQALTSAATQTVNKLDDFFNNALNTLRAESQLPALEDFLALPADLRAGTPQAREVAGLLRLLTEKDSRVSEYLLLDQSGWVAAASSTIDIGKDHRNRDYFTQPLETAQPYISPVSFYDGATVGSLYLSYAIRDERFNTIGVLVVRYDAEQVLQDFIFTTNDQAGPGSFAVVFDDYQLHLAHGIAPETLFTLVGPVNPEVIAYLRNTYRLPTTSPANPTVDLPDLQRQLLSVPDDRPLSFTAEDIATGSRLNQVSALRMESPPWTVAFFQPRDVFLAPAVAQSQTNVLVAVFMAGLMTLAALGVAHLLAGPIARLTEVAGKVTAGDLTAQARVESSDETGMLAEAFNSMTSRLRELIEFLEQRVRQRTAQLQAAADISRATAQIRDLNQLLKLALELIRERFGFYHASIFLMDEAGEFAVVRESTGTVGAELKARGHRLAVDSNSLIGWVTRNRRPRVALDVAEDPFHFKNPLLPNTRSELAIPLIVGDRLLGALDVQSTALNAFGESDVQVLQTLADQLSIAIENAELFERAQASLEEMSGLYQEVAGTGWRSLVRGQPREVVYDLQPAPDRLRPAHPVGAGRDGLASNAPTLPGVAFTTSITVPLELRGQIVGAIELHGRQMGDLTAEERAVLDTVAAQVSVALESAALLEETLRRSRRERLINEITYRMRSDLNPAAIMQSGIRELGKALGATEVVVKLSPTESPGLAEDAPES
jgi:GAF domain-containing protein/HAMP domain-containing protein